MFLAYFIHHIYHLITLFQDWAVKSFHANLITNCLIIAPYFITAFETIEYKTLYLPNLLKIDIDLNS